MGVWVCGFVDLCERRREKRVEGEGEGGRCEALRGAARGPGRHIRPASLTSSRISTGGAVHNFPPFADLARL